jgi:hypothetical protein
VAVGILGELDESIDETDFDFLESSAVVLVAESVQLANDLPQLGVEHVLDAVFGSEWGNKNLPGMSLEMRAHRLPCWAWSWTRVCSYSLDHFSFLIPPLR